MIDFHEDEWRRVQREAQSAGQVSPASSAEILVTAALFVVSLLAILGLVLSVSTDGDSESSWVVGALGLGAVLAVESLLLLMLAARRRRKLLVKAARLAMFLEARRPEIEAIPQPSDRERGWLVEALALRDALIASRDMREADRLNACLPIGLRRVSDPGVS
jgi:hypothetical protein